MIDKASSNVNIQYNIATYKTMRMNKKKSEFTMKHHNLSQIF